LAAARKSIIGFMFDCDNKRFINLEPYEIRKAKSTTLNYVAFILKMKGKSVL